MPHYLSASSINDTSIGVLMFVDPPPANSYYIYITCNETGQRSGDLGFGSGNSSSSQLFTGLTPGTTYNFTGEIRPTSGGSTQYVYRSFTTTGSPPPLQNARISALEIKDKSLNLGVYSLDKTASNYYIYITRDDTGERSPDLGFGTAYNSSHYNFTGLKANTNYSFTAQIIDNGTSYYKYRTFTTAMPMRPNNFSWDYAKTSGGTFNITANEWNRLLNSINDFREYKGISRTSWTYSAVSGADFTANHYNEARNAMAILTTSVPPTKSKGNTIYASDINQLRDALNSVT